MLFGVVHTWLGLPDEDSLSRGLAVPVSGEEARLPPVDRQGRALASAVAANGPCIGPCKATLMLGRLHSHCPAKLFTKGVGISSSDPGGALTNWVL